MDLLSIFEVVVTSLSPIIVAWFGVSANKNAKQTKKYMESQEALKVANAKIKEREQQDLQDQLSSLDAAIKQLTQQVSSIEKSISVIPEIDKRLDNLVKMSAINFEFCTSLSSTVSAIGTELDSKTEIDAADLKLERHKQKEEELINRAVKIVY